MSVALVLVVLLAPIPSPLAPAPYSTVSAVILMRCHFMFAPLVPHFMSMAVTAQRCVTLTLSSSDLALK